MFNSNEFVNINCIVNKLNSEIDVLDASIEELDNLNLTDNIEESFNILLIKLEEVRQFKRYWKDYSRSYKLAVERDVSSRDKKLKEMEVENMKIKTENQQLRKQIEQLNKLYDKLEDADKVIAQIKEQEKTLKEIKSKFDNADTLLSKITKNIGFFRNQEEVKEQAKSKERVGVNAPAFKKDIDDSVIEEDIKAGLSISELAKKHGMTYQGMKYRVNKIKEKMEETNNG